MMELSLLCYADNLIRDKFRAGLEGHRIRKPIAMQCSGISKENRARFKPLPKRRVKKESVGRTSYVRLVEYAMRWQRERDC